MNRTKKQNAFTVIELLVVISIIGILAAIVGASMNNARRGGRDAGAKAELVQIQAALELCYQKVIPGAYPDFTGSNGMTPWVDVSGGPTSIVCGGTTFMNPVPTSSGFNNYQWNDYDDDQRYGLRVDLEGSGCLTITQVGVTETTSGGCP